MHHTLLSNREVADRLDKIENAIAYLYEYLATRDKKSIVPENTNISCMELTKKGLEEACEKYLGPNKEW